MNRNTETRLRSITGGLTGRREIDIVFLQEEIEKNRYDATVTDALKRILRCLTVAEMHPAILIA